VDNHGETTVPETESEKYERRRRFGEESFVIG
jgi:hypothetical protein